MDSLGEQALRRRPDEIPAAEQQNRGPGARVADTAGRINAAAGHTLAQHLTYADDHLEQRMGASRAELRGVESRSAVPDGAPEQQLFSDWAHGDDTSELDELELRRLSEAAERGALMGTRRLDKVRAEWREFTRRLEGSAMTTAELRRLRLELRRREVFLFVLGGFLLVMGALYGALVFSSPQLLGNPRSEFGCAMFGGSWAETQTGKSYCIFWAQ
ncbi:hypothetical protein [Rhodoligotrophos defluvii]|uniref:hypothetical protein n=1 Tax=Rhodoligotrophos defluvii TaxID=2561934 RepID=UPI0010C9CFA4|nr:hypothetical protein [Rhodoligotrophos defluvii]